MCGRLSCVSVRTYRRVHLRVDWLFIVILVDDSPISDSIWVGLTPAILHKTGWQARSNFGTDSFPNLDLALEARLEARRV
jgi:hypothetical protein